MMLLQEKSLYASKLSEICALGNNLDWEDANDLLERIRPLIEVTKGRLQEPKNQK